MASRPSAIHIVQDVVGCKWMLDIIEGVRNNVRRPGAMAKNIQGVSTKVLNERLIKLVAFGILQKQVYPEIPPRVEYEVTKLGSQFFPILDLINKLQDELDHGKFSMN